MRSSVIVPRMLTAPELCAACKFLTLCQNDKGTGWEALDMMDPSANAQAREILAIIRATREAMRQHPEAVQAALKEIEDKMRNHAPDIESMKNIFTGAQIAQKQESR